MPDPLQMIIVSIVMVFASLVLLGIVVSLISKIALRMQKPSSEVKAEEQPVKNT